MKHLLGICVLAALAAGSAGCAGLPEALGAAPAQEQGSLQASGLAAQKELLGKLIDNLDKLANSVVFEPVDKTMPMTITNARLTMRTIDSRAFDMVVKLADFTVYKDPPGFWTWANNLLDKGMADAERIAPWFFVSEMWQSAKCGGSTTTTYANTGGGYSPVNANLGSGSYAGGTWSYSLAAQ